jgi:peptidyl-tRNA hydrolase, PTH1 family
VILIVGLGNPGKEYEKTRHNAGFRVVDRIRDTIQVTEHQSTRWYTLYEGYYEGNQLLCLYPLTYMNRSGIAVSDVTRDYSIEVQNIIVIYDDFNLPLGSIRIREGGSSGGHNGLASVLELMNTESIPRVRLGLYNEQSFSKNNDAADFVLSPFEQDEIQFAETMFQKAHDATLMIVRDGVSKAMNSFNQTLDQFKSTSITKDRES